MLIANNFLNVTVLPNDSITQLATRKTPISLWSELHCYLSVIM